MENSLLKIILNFFSCLFIFIKISKRQTLFTQKKIGLVFKKVFFFNFGYKTLFRNYRKFRNILLFVDYIKSGP
jgi:hypothetical protein